jgi:hypothetical protein
MPSIITETADDLTAELKAQVAMLNDLPQDQAPKKSNIFAAFSALVNEARGPVNARTGVRLRKDEVMYRLADFGTANVEPEHVKRLAKAMGVNYQKEPFLLPILLDTLLRPLPEDWATRNIGSDSHFVYVHRLSGRTTTVNPIQIVAQRELATARGKRTSAHYDRAEFFLKFKPLDRPVYYWDFLDDVYVPDADALHEILHPPIFNPLVALSPPQLSSRFYMTAD